MAQFVPSANPKGNTTAPKGNTTDPKRPSADPKVARMLVSMSAAVYVPYEDFQKDKSEADPKLIESIFNERSLGEVLEQNSSRLYNLGYSYSGTQKGKYLTEQDRTWSQKYIILKSLIYDTSKLTTIWGYNTFGGKQWGGLIAFQDLGYSTDTKHPHTRNVNVLIAFRGTKAPTEWAANLNAQKIKPSYSSNDQMQVHYGIDLLYQTLQQSNKEEKKQESSFSFSRSKLETLIKRYLKKLNQFKILDIVRISNIYITGHSLGGGLAVLCARELLETVKRNTRVHLYTFGAPLVGNNIFAENFNSFLKKGHASYRFYQKYDQVPTVPYEKWGFKHVKLGYILPDLELEKLNKTSSYTDVSSLTNLALEAHNIVRYKKNVLMQVGNLQSGVTESLSLNNGKHFSSRSPALSTLTSSDELVFLNGEKVIFDKAVATTPVTIESKTHSLSEI